MFDNLYFLISLPCLQFEVSLLELVLCTHSTSRLLGDMDKPTSSVPKSVKRKVKKEPKYKVIYVTVGGRQEQLEFLADAGPDEIRSLLLSAAEINYECVLKLCTDDGTVLPLNNAIPSNGPNNRYNIELVAVPLIGSGTFTAKGDSSLLITQ